MPQPQVRDDYNDERESIVKCHNSKERIMIRHRCLRTSDLSPNLAEMYSMPDIWHRNLKPKGHSMLSTLAIETVLIQIKAAS